MKNSEWRKNFSTLPSPGGRDRMLEERCQNVNKHIPSATRVRSARLPGTNQVGVFELFGWPEFPPAIGPLFRSELH